MLFLGTSSTAISDESTTNPIVIDGTSTTVTSGNVVLYNDQEYVWTGSKWEHLGQDSSFKTIQNEVSSPEANGSTTAFIDTITQNANGVITATKKNVQFPSLSGGSATANDPTVVGGVTVNGHAVTVNKKTLTAGTNVTITGGSDSITITAKDTTYNNFVKSGSGAKAGLVPAPPTTEGTTKYLREDGSWSVPSNNKVLQTVTSSNAEYPLLLAPPGQSATTTTSAYFDSGITVNPSTNTISATAEYSKSSVLTYLIPAVTGTIFDAAKAQPDGTEKSYFAGSDGLIVGAPSQYCILSVKKKNSRTIITSYSFSEDNAGSTQYNVCMDTSVDDPQWSGWTDILVNALPITGGTLTGGLAIGNSTQSSAPDFGIKVHDIRNVAVTPDTFGNQNVNFYFSKANSRWSGIIHMKAWQGAYAAWELAGNANEASSNTLLYRQGIGETWDDWKTIAFTDSNITGNAATATKASQDGNGANIASTYLKLAGGTMSGSLNISKNTTDTTYGLGFTGTNTSSNTIKFFLTGKKSYISAPSSGGIALCANDQTSFGNSGLIVNTSDVSPGTTNTFTLGTNTYKWKNVYSEAFTGSSLTISNETPRTTYTNSSETGYVELNNGYMCLGRSIDNSLKVDASGNLIIPPGCHGTSLPESGVEGQIFFLHD